MLKCMEWYGDFQQMDCTFNRRIPKPEMVYGFVLYYASLLTNPLYGSWMQHCSWFLVRVSVFCWFLVAIHLHFLLMPDIFLFMFQNVSKKLLFAVRKDGWSPVERYPQPCWLMGIVRWYGLVLHGFFTKIHWIAINQTDPNRGWGWQKISPTIQVGSYFIWRTSDCNFTAGTLYAVALHLTTTGGQGAKDVADPPNPLVV